MAVSKCISLTAPANKNENAAGALSKSMDESGAHGTEEFPVAVYRDDVTENAVSWHWHTEFEIGFVTAGSVRMECANGNYALNEGDVFFINSNVLHAMRNGDPPHSAVFKSIVFHGSVIGGAQNSVFYKKYLLPVLHNQNFREMILSVNSSRYQNIFSMMNVVWDSVFSESQDYEMTVRSELSKLFCALIRFPENSLSIQTEHNFIQESRVQTILAYIGEHYSENITLCDLAKSASISKSEALRCFKEIVGQSPIQHLKAYRLQNAARMIRNTDYPIGTICESCGFGDNSYFSKSFKEMYHCTPHEYKRAQMQKACCTERKGNAEFEEDLQDEGYTDF